MNSLNWLDRSTGLVHRLGYSDELFGYAHLSMACRVTFVLHGQGANKGDATRYESNDATYCVIENTKEIPTCIGCSV